MEDLVWHPETGALYEAPDPADTIHRSKAGGEPPLLLPFSALLAIRDAVSVLVGRS